jgi:hypothetical protein
VAGVPQPQMPPLFSAALNLDGARTREEWLRITQVLELEWSDATRLPPDHVAPACEVLALALDWNERVLAHEILSRYMRPWAARAAGHPGLGPTAHAVATAFADDIANLPGRS